MLHLPATKREEPLETLKYTEYSQFQDIPYFAV
jgi:hypothetical protein